MVIITTGLAQTPKQTKADQDFLAYDYTEAIDGYEKLVKKGVSNQEIYQKLGDANYYNARYEEASEWYGRLMQLNNDQFAPEYMYRYAQSLKSLGDYEKSDHWMELFYTKTKALDARAKNFEDNRNYLERIRALSGNYSIAQVNFNSGVSDFAPSFYEGGIVFSSARDTGLISKNIHEWNKGAFLDLYQVNLDQDGSEMGVKPFAKPVNGRTHESSTVFSKDGTTLYFTRNNSNNGKNFSRDDKGISRLKLMKASLVDGKWQNIEVLPFNDDSYSVAHPALNKAEDRLYFSSDMPGTLGESDIFYVDINSDGTYGKPMNLGKGVNTESRETFPFVNENDILFFASDGHPGLGGLDIFAINLMNDTAGILNIGSPINSASDDFAFIINSKNKGYFSSNRGDDLGNDDIYSFEANKPIAFNCSANTSGVALNKEDGSLIPNASITVTDAQGQLVATTMTNTTGEFSFELDCNTIKNYTLTATKQNFNPGSSTVFIETNTDIDGIEVFLEPLEKEPEIGEDLAKLLDLEPIYFDLDKAKIREDSKQVLGKVIAYMSRHPNVKIDIRSHTDSKSSQRYNLSLSERRANSTKDYLISKGVDADRLTAKGYGESQLVNHCSDGVSCSKELHQENRRSEFVVVQ